MKSVALLLLLFGALQTGAAPHGSIQGVVRRTGTMDPVSDVTVTLKGPTSEQMVTTGSDGKFIFRNVPPDTRYAVSSVKDGYFGPVFFNGVALPTATVGASVSDGEDVQGLVLKMNPGGTITGTITDREGRPEARTTVELSQIDYENGRRVLTPVKTVQTDNRGEYRLYWISPGEYLLDAVNAQRNPGAFVSRYPVYYPDGGTAAAGATPLTIGSGEEIVASFRIGSSSTFKLSGKITTPEATFSSASPTFYLIPRDPAAVRKASIAANNAVTNASVDRSLGTFVIPGILPGSYELIAQVSGEKSATYSARIPVDIEDKDVEGITLAAHRDTVLRFQLDIQGDTGEIKKVVPLRVRIKVFPKDGSPSRLLKNAEIPWLPNETWGLPNVPDGEYGIVVLGLPPEAYVADILQGSRSVYRDGSFAVRSTPNEIIHVVVTLDAGSVQGSIRDAAPASISSNQIYAVLVPSLPLRQNFQLYRVQGTRSDGKFSLPGVAPGNYTLFAFEGVPNEAWFNPEFLMKYETRGNLVSVEAGKANQVLAPLVAIQVDKR